MTADAFTPEMFERARADIDRVRPARAHIGKPTGDDFRHFALAIGDDNPLWIKPSHAQESVGEEIAPPVFLWTSFMTPMHFPSHSKVRSNGAGFPGTQAIFSGCKFRFFRPIHAGDELSAKSVRRGIIDPLDRQPGDCTDPRADLDAAMRSSEAYCPKPDARLVYQIECHSCFDADGNIVGDLIEHIARQETDIIDPALGKYGAFKPRRYTLDDLKMIGDHYAEEASHLRGSEPRYWDDVAIGDALPKLVKGPLTILSYCAFFTGFAPFFNFTDRVLYNFASRFPEAVKHDPETGIWLLPEEMHWHPHMARILGMPEGFDVGAQRVGWLAHLVTDWMGDRAWLEELDVWFERPLFLSEAVWITGSVVSKDAATATNGRVTLDLAATTLDGAVISRAKAMVNLPRAAAGTTPVWKLTS